MLEDMKTEAKKIATAIAKLEARALRNTVAQDLDGLRAALPDHEAVLSRALDYVIRSEYRAARK